MTFVLFVHYNSVTISWLFTEGEQPTPGCLLRGSNHLLFVYCGGATISWLFTERMQPSPDCLPRGSNHLLLVYRGRGMQPTDCLPRGSILPQMEVGTPVRKCVWVSSSSGRSTTGLALNTTRRTSSATHLLNDLLQEDKILRRVSRRQNYRITTLLRVEYKLEHPWLRSQRRVREGLYISVSGRYVSRRER